MSYFPSIAIEFQLIDVGMRWRQQAHCSYFISFKKKVNKQAKNCGSNKTAHGRLQCLFDLEIMWKKGTFVSNDGFFLSSIFLSFIASRCANEIDRKKKQANTVRCSSYQADTEYRKEDRRSAATSSLLMNIIISFFSVIFIRLTSVIFIDFSCLLFVFFSFSFSRCRCQSTDTGIGLINVSSSQFSGNIIRRMSNVCIDISIQSVENERKKAKINHCSHDVCYEYSTALGSISGILCVAVHPEIRHQTRCFHIWFCWAKDHVQK